MYSHDFTWKQRGQIDFTIGVQFVSCPCTDAIPVQQWEAGWIDAQRQALDRDMRITNAAAKLVLDYVRTRP